jgi:ankyrin repeat protein
MMPTAVDSIIAGDVKSLETMRGLAPSVMKWVEVSLPFAHQDHQLKNRLKNLLGAPLLTPNLAYFGLWGHLIEVCEVKALELGQEMQQYFEKNNLGTVLGEAFVPNTCGKFQVGNGGLLHVVSCAADEGERRQDGAMPKIPMFPRSSVHSQLWNEQCFIHCIRMIAMGIDQPYQNVVSEVCTRSKGTFKETTIKGFVRMLNKCVSKDDHYWEAYPRPSLNIDLNRNACTFDKPKDLLTFIENMKNHPTIANHPVRIKNMFLFDKDRAEKHFFYRTVMINWLYTSGMTYGELAKKAGKLWNTYLNFAVVRGYGEKDPSASVGTWRKQIAVAMAYLTSPELKDNKVQFIVETQLLLHPYLVGRQKMHLLYKICRADNPEALHSDFLKSTADPETSFDDMAQRSLLETQFFLAKTSDVNCQHKEHRGATHLWLRAEQGHAEAVQEILQHPEVDPNAVRRETHTTPLFIASHYGHTEVVKAILSHPNVRVNLGKLSTNTSPLYQAVQGGHEGATEALLPTQAVDVNQCTNAGNTPLGKACELGNEYIVGLLLSTEGISVNCQLKGGNTALSIATQNNNTDIVEMLRVHLNLNEETVSKGNQLRPAASTVHHMTPPSGVAIASGEAAKGAVMSVGLGIEHGASSDEKQIDCRTILARKGSDFLSPMETSKMVNAPSEGLRNILGMDAQVNNESKPKVQKMPSQGW